jgi:NADH dehydrogenase FAD-containing subunit
MEDKVIANVSSSYAEDQNEQYIKISFTGTGKDGTEPATGLHMHADNINTMHKIQAAVYLWEHISEYLKKNDDSATDMITNCLLAKYKELMEKEEKHEKF